MPNLPGLLAIGKHSHFGDASSMFGDFVFFLFSEMDDQCSDTPMVFIGDLSQIHNVYGLMKLYYWEHISIIGDINCFIWGGETFIFGD